MFAPRFEQGSLFKILDETHGLVYEREGGTQARGGSEGGHSCEFRWSKPCSGVVLVALARAPNPFTVQLVSKMHHFGYTSGSERGAQPEVFGRSAHNAMTLWWVPLRKGVLIQLYNVVVVQILSFIDWRVAAIPGRLCLRYGVLYR